MDDLIYFEVKGNSMSPTFKDGDSVLFKKMNTNYKAIVNDIVVFMHPLRRDFKLIKRVSHIKDETKLFVEGDNTDISSSDDSHNFGYIDSSDLIAIKQN
tara:strand:- start:1059 stop:1355 length:297 start_codon:yes stop_codon:yes gene_type:complete